METTYLFGAGASFGVLPIVNQFEAALEDFSKALVSFETRVGLGFLKIQPSDDSEAVPSREEKYSELGFKVSWLINELKNVASIDTLAKRLRIREEYDKLEDLQGILTILFKYIQLTTKVSPRHDSFFASVLNTTIDLPRSLNILTWNYDNQFEIAYSRYLNSSQNNPFYEARRRLNFSFPGMGSISYDNLNYIKLNGSADFYEKQGKSVQIEIEGKSNFQILDDLVSQFFTFKNKDLDCGVKFAWDTDQKKAYLQTLLPAVQKTRTLIVIGYSFPYFNKEIDSLLLENMSRLSNIFIQDPNSSDIWETMQTYNKIRTNPSIKILTNTKQFFIPPSL